MDKKEHLDNFMDNLVGQNTKVDVSSQYIPDDDMWSITARVIFRASRNGMDWGEAALATTLVAEDHKQGSATLFSNIFQYLSSVEFVQGLYDSVVSAEENELGDRRPWEQKQD